MAENDKDFEGWKETQYDISCVNMAGGFYKTAVVGRVSGRFGVHPASGNHYSLTHLASGWACFHFQNEESAQEVAAILEERYAEMFDQLSVDGWDVANFADLDKQVNDDPDLKAIWFTDGLRLGKKSKANRALMNIIS